MRASFTRISRKASRTQRRKKAAIANSTGAEPIENSASRQSMPKIAIRMKREANDVADQADDPRGEHLVQRLDVVGQPGHEATDGVRSKNEADRDRTWRWARARRSFMPSCPSTCVRYICAKAAPYCPTSARRYSDGQRDRGRRAVRRRCARRSPA